MKYRMKTSGLLSASNCMWSGHGVITVYLQLHLTYGLENNGVHVFIDCSAWTLIVRPGLLATV